MRNRLDELKPNKELREYAEARIGKITESQRQMLIVAAKYGKDLEPAGPLAGKPDPE